MPYYLIQAVYTADSWATQTRNPQNANDRVRPPVEALGGRIESVYYAFGEYDAVAIVEVPDNVNSGAFSIRASAGGPIKDIKTTPLMTAEEGMEMMRKAGAAEYRPPGGNLVSILGAIPV